MPSYDVKSGDQSYLAAKITSTQTSGITIAAMNINGTSTAWANTAGVIEVSEQSDATLKREWIYYTGTSVSAANVATLTGVVRGLSSSTSDVTSGGTGVAFSKGAVVRFVTFHDLLNKKANLDRANTWTATQTFGTSGKIVFTSTAGEQLVLQTLTTAQRDALSSPANGSVIYNSTTGQVNYREGGAWVANASVGSVADGSASVAGKFEEATVAEQIAKTATGSTGARTIPAVANMITTSAGAADEGKIVTMNSAGVADVSTGGTGVRNPTSGSVYIGAGASPMTAVAPSTSGNVLKSNGSAWVSGTVSTTSQVVYCSTADSATLTNPTSDTSFDTHTYTISANDLIAGVAYEIEGFVEWTPASTYTFTTMIRLGSTSFASVVGTASAGSTRNTLVKGKIMGTAAAGASVTVNSEIWGGDPGGAPLSAAVSAASTTVATNGTLVLALGGKFGTSNGGNTAVLRNVIIRKLSSTAF